MAFLVFQLQAPLASWGEPAVGEYRGSCGYPGESALIGLLGAALGLASATRRTRAAALFGLLSFAGLFAFYLRAPSLTSRYLVDFAPAIGALFQPLVLAGEPGPWRALRSGLLAVLFLGAGLSAAELPRAYHGPASFERDALSEAIAPAGGFTPPITGPDALEARLAPKRLECLGLPEVYDWSSDPAATGIVAAGDGMNVHTGQTGPAVVLYFGQPRCLELGFEGPPGGSFSAAALQEVRAKVGGVELLPVHHTVTASRSTVWFRAPLGQRVEEPGPVFIATVNRSRAFAETPAFSLVSAATRCPPGNEP